MSKLSVNTMNMIQNLLSDLFYQNYPQPLLTETERIFILNYLNCYHLSSSSPFLLHTSFHMNVEDDYYRHLILQNDWTILELPVSAMSGRRVFWIVMNKCIYQIETNMEIDKCKLVVRRFQI